MIRITLSAVLVALSVGPLLGQQTKPTFEAASVRAAARGAISRAQLVPGGRFLAENVFLEFLLQQVYDVQDFQIVAPAPVRAMLSGASATRYTIEATANADTASGR